MMRSNITVFSKSETVPKKNRLPSVPPSAELIRNTFSMQALATSRSDHTFATHRTRTLLAGCLVHIALLGAALMSPVSARGDELDSSVGKENFDPSSSGAYLDGITLDVKKSEAAESEIHKRAVKSRSYVEEIVVTANRRVERIQDIASGIQVMDGEDLEQSNAAGFSDYLFKVPGVDIVDAGVPKQIAIRGISNLASRVTQNNSSASPVGLYLNDSAIQGNGIMPDLSLYDLQRVEVLKGPQGTFYGEGAMGGMIRMVLNDANPEEFMFKGDLAMGHTKNGSGNDYVANVAVNVPLSENWATRIVASERVNQGYIDFPGRGTKGEDDASSRSYRIHLNGSLFDTLKVSAFMLNQHQQLDQFPQAQPDEEGEFQNRNLEPQYQDIKFSLSSVALSYAADFAEISSTTSQFKNDTDLLLRLTLLSSTLDSRISGTPLLSSLLPPLISGTQDLGVLREEWSASNSEQVGWSQEFRAVSTSDGWFNWVAGLYYRDRENNLKGLADSDATHDLPPPLGPGTLFLDIAETFEQWSAFGELGFQLTDGLELKVGTRGYTEDVESDVRAELRGPLYLVALPSGERSGDIKITTQTVTKMASLSWDFADDKMLFVKYAEGSRSGGTNSNAIIYEMPDSYEPDFLKSVELGLKSQWWDQLLTVNVALFNQEWTDMQVGVTISDATLRGTGGVVTLPANAILNVAEAYSRGAEVELGVNPAPGVSMAISGFYGEGEIKKGDPEAFIPAGVPLPQLPKWSYSASLSYSPSEFQLAQMTPYFGVDTQYTSDRAAYPPGGGIGLPEDSTLKAFSVWNAMLGLNGENWSFSLGVKNLTDERYAVGIQQFEEATQTIARPRSFLFKVAYQM